MSLPYREGDTIVAPATPPGVGALAVIRISGPGAIAIADRIFTGAARPSTAPPRTLLHGEITGDSDGDRIDEVLLATFRAPASYTGEDSVEISSHGAPYLVRRIVGRIVSEGARPAGPGEFTRRAFRNGRIDLAQAESVADLVRARTAGAARSALRQLHGKLSKRLGALRERLVDLLAGIEADLDFAAEEEVPSYDRDAARAIVSESSEEIAALVAEGERGRIVREGVRVVLAGRPNSGKSTLFNALLGEDRAIVSEEPGTTRDVLEGEIEIGGVLFHLSDTAGVREDGAGAGAGTGTVEGEGIRRAAERHEGADLLLVVVDGSEPLIAEDRGWLERSAGRKRVLALTKKDLGRRAGELPLEEGEAPFGVCAPTGDGLEAIREELFRIATGGAGEEVGEPEVTSARHLDALRRASASLDAARGVIDRGELLAEDLRATVGAIDEITGKGAPEELLDRIFSRFCIGK